jgi:cytochrome oxidase Cu insertion factor (SCO1/SenC/PrrC family)
MPLPAPATRWSTGTWITSARWTAALLAIVLALAASPGWAQEQTDDVHLSLTGKLTFVDPSETTVTSDDFKGQWMLVYFGYMHCADLCPWGLTVMGSAIDMLGPAARFVQPLFITVDPERDRGPALAEFTHSFHERLIGLTGSQAEIRAAADAMGVRFTRVEQGDGYSVDHSSSYSLIDPQRRTVLTFRKAEAHLVAVKVVDVLAKAGVKLEGMPGLGALR